MLPQLIYTYFIGLSVSLVLYGLWEDQLTAKKQKPIKRILNIIICNLTYLLSCNINIIHCKMIDKSAM